MLWKAKVNLHSLKLVFSTSDVYKMMWKKKYKNLLGEPYDRVNDVSLIKSTWSFKNSF